MFNHSCAPNCVVNANTQSLEITTTRAVNRGSELSIGYVKHEGVPRAIRRKQLLQHYHFLCGCQRCEDESDGVSAVTDGARSSGSEVEPGCSSTVRVLMLMV